MGELVRSIALLRGRGYRPRSPPDIWSISRSIVPILSPSCSSSIRRSVRWFVRRDGWVVRCTKNAIPTDFGEEGSPSPGRFEGLFGLFATRSPSRSISFPHGGKRPAARTNRPCNRPSIHHGLSDYRSISFSLRPPSPLSFSLHGH